MSPNAKRSEGATVVRAKKTLHVVASPPRDADVNDICWLSDDDDLFYFPASPPPPGRHTVAWAMGINVALPSADFVALVEVDEPNMRARTWGVVPFVALIEEGVAGHFMGIANDRFYIRKEGWPTEEWVDRNRVDGREQT